jgi:hypothetical protein
MGAFGCASILTQDSPLYSKLVDGKKSIGSFASYKYSGGLRGNVGYIDKTPMCWEVVEKVRVAEKQRRGYVFVWVEMMIFGLGFYDAARVEAIIDVSKKSEPLASFESSKKLKCGDKEPAAFEKLILYDRQQTFEILVETDQYGQIDFDKYLADRNKTINLVVQLASDKTEAVSFLYTPRHLR